MERRRQGCLVHSQIQSPGPLIMSDPNQYAATEDFEFAALSEARNYRRAIVEEFRPYLRGRVLEVGAGIGQTTEELLKLASVSEVVAVEPEQRFLGGFQERLPAVRLVHGTTGDLHPGECYDGVVLVNVLEHIEDDRSELQRIRGLLRERNGCICILVPARPELYSRIDGFFGHFRRYTRKELGDKLDEAGSTRCQLSYFNFVGYFAWALRFRLMGSMTFDIDQVRFFDRRIFPLVHRLESKMCRPPIGQSVLAIARTR
jgi:SAM-dependent methyltransferase